MASFAVPCKPRCLGCNNCVLACPFGVPKMESDFDLMMKCDLCYDRTSVGKKPMCASVCPSGALFFGTREEIERQRPRSGADQPLSVWRADRPHQGQPDGSAPRFAAAH